MMPFHSGEIAVQARIGVRDEAEQVGRVISFAIKPAAVEFLRTQQIAIASTIDINGNLWASLLTGLPGFIQVIDAQTIQVNPFPIQNPEAPSMAGHSPIPNQQMGLLVIDLSTRKRLRLNGTVIGSNEIGAPGDILQIQIQQVFFNCPKYIQTRTLKVREIAAHQEESATSAPAPPIPVRSALNAADRVWIAQSDTFFIASAHSEQGADASHRGGYPGFVRVVDDRTLLFPDYSGNNMFQTLGNLFGNPKAGLLFVEFEQGHTLQLTGQAKILWDGEQLATFAGAQRLIEFSIEQILETRHASPLRWQFGEYSPVNPYPPVVDIGEHFSNR